MLLLLVLFHSAWAGTSVWATSDTDALRWPDATLVSMKVQKGDELELLVTDGAKVRVRKGTDYGWLDVTSTSTTAPADPASGAPVTTDPAAPADGAAPAGDAPTPPPQ